MENPAKKIWAYGATGLMALNKFIRELDNVLFKVTIDYITRNFDPTGININGLIDSAWAVWIKPAMLSFTKTSIGRFTNFKQALQSLTAQRPTLKKLHPVGWQRHPGFFN